MTDLQTSIIPGTVGYREIETHRKDGFTELRIQYYQSPDWSGDRRPKLKRVM